MIQGWLGVWWYLYAGVWRFYAALSGAENSGIDSTVQGFERRKAGMRNCRVMGVLVRWLFLMG